MARPFHNKQNGASYEAGGKPVTAEGIPPSSKNLAYSTNGWPYSNSEFGDPNQFRARPIKHWRLQYGNTNDKQSFRNRYLIDTLNRPGSFVTNTGKKDNLTACDLPDFLNIPYKEGNQTTVFGILNDHVGKLNRVGRYNPIYANVNDPSDNFYPSNQWACSSCPTLACNTINPPPNPQDCEDFPPKRCINICDPPSKALYRARPTASRINRKDLCERPYNQTNHS